MEDFQPGERAYLYTHELPSLKRFYPHVEEVIVTVVDNLGFGGYRVVAPPDLSLFVPVNFLHMKSMNSRLPLNKDFSILLDNEY